MDWLKEIFSIYIDLLMLLSGAYMAFIQSNNLVTDESLEREGRFCKVAGYFYIALGIAGIIITIIRV